MSDPLVQAYTSQTAPVAAGSAMVPPLQPAVPGTPHLSSANPPSHLIPPLLPAAQPSATTAATPHSGGMIQLLPSSAQVQKEPTSAGLHHYHSSPSPHSHARSQSTVVPMHSPTQGYDGMLGAPVSSRLHGSMGGATLPSAVPAMATSPSTTAALQGIISPPPIAALAADTYSYPAESGGYDVYAEIGSGAFSTVYRGVVRDNGEEVAIKVIDLDLFNTNWDEIRREILIMSQLQHPNVVRLKTAFVDGQDLWIVMSLMTAGSCASVMKELGWMNGIKDEVAIATILREVLQALAYFHKHGSIHRSVRWLLSLCRQVHAPLTALAYCGSVLRLSCSLVMSKQAIYCCQVPAMYCWRTLVLRVH
jgi:hypothetical protein